MRKKQTRRPKYRLLKAGCVGAGLLSISNPTQVTAADLGILNAKSGTLTTIPNPFPDLQLGVHVAAGDLDGDGKADIVVGTGSGPNKIGIKLSDGLSLNFNKFEIKYMEQQHGINVATGDLDGDGKADIVVTPSTGARSHGHYIKVGDVKGEMALVPIGEFDDAFDGFPGGLSVATGDLNDDDVTDVIVATHRTSCCATGTHIKKAILSAAFKGFDPPFPDGTPGVHIAAGDVNGDGFAEVIAVASRKQIDKSSPILARYGDPGWIKIGGSDGLPLDLAGVHVAMGDVDGDGLMDLVTGSPAGELPVIKVYSITGGAGTPFTLDHKGDWFPYANTFLGGIRVATGDVTGDGIYDIVFGPASVPEPATFGSLLVGIGAWLLGGWRRKRDGAPPG